MTSQQDTEPTRRLAIRGLVGLAALVFGVLAALAIQHHTKPGNLLHAPDKWLMDWQIFVLSERVDAQRDDLTVLYISGESLEEYASLSPIDRGLLAALVRRIDASGARAIGLDFIIDRPSTARKDAMLARAIRDVKTPVVLGVIDIRSRGIGPADLDFQQTFLDDSGAVPGHIYFQRTEYRLHLGDDVVRTQARSSASSAYKTSFAHALAAVSGAKGCDACTGLVAWLKRDDGSIKDVFTTLTVPRHAPLGARLTPEVILPDALTHLVKDRIVLIGGNFPDRDQHLTPMSLRDGDTVPGLLIHAQILAQVIDGRQVQQLSRMAILVSLSVATAAGVLFGLYFSRLWIDVVVGIGVFIVGVVVMNGYMIIVPSTILLAWAVGLTVGYLIAWLSGFRQMRTKN